MKRKTFKRGLALGALMAFVITGSAMAAEIGSVYSGSLAGYANELRGDVTITAGDAYVTSSTLGMIYFGAFVGSTTETIDILGDNISITSVVRDYVNRGAYIQCGNFNIGNSKSVIDIKAESNNGNANGILATFGGYVNLLADTLKMNVTSTNASARGICVESSNRSDHVSFGNGEIYLGSDDSTIKSIDINVTGKDEAIGIASMGCTYDGKGSVLIVNADTLKVTVQGYGLGIHAQNNTQNEGITPASNTAKVIINAKDTIVKSDFIGLSAFSNGLLEIKGNLTVDAPTAINARGNSIININQGTDNKVVLTGDIEFSTPGPYEGSGDIVNADVNINLSNADSSWKGNVLKGYPSDWTNPANTEVKDFELTLSNGAQWTPTVVTGSELGAEDYLGQASINNLVVNNGVVNLTEANAVAKIDSLTGSGGTFNVSDLSAKAEIGVLVQDENGKEPEITVNGSGAIADAIASGEASLQDLANTVTNGSGENATTAATTIATEEGLVAGAMSADVTLDENGNLVLANQKVATNKTNEALADSGSALKAHWRHHMNDMNKRMGELRNANGEHGVWTRMVRGENEYQGAKAQYNQYQLGYDEKLSVDKRWTVGAAVTFAEGDSNYGKGSTEDDSTAFAIYGSKLNNDGTFVDLIARYARLESDLTSNTGDTADYSTNGYSVSAEFGRRIQQGKGLWIEPQFELTYGTIDSAEYVIGGRKVYMDSMDSLIARAGFAIGKDIKQGNVYARASYLYDFDGEADTYVSAATAGSAVDQHKEDLGGGWWEVGVGANINLSKATYIYADVEKTFGGEVDTNWQWNLGVRYSF